MKDLEKKTCRLGLVQAEPVLFDERASLQKALKYVDEAAANGKVHRKLKPTGSERLIWGDADKHYFPVTETPWARSAALYAGRAICRLPE